VDDIIESAGEPGLLLTAMAEKAATEGDGPKALQYLKAAGKWAQEAATKIGVEVAAAAIKSAMGVGKP
jgi:hypothetical protein